MRKVIGSLLAVWFLASLSYAATTRFTETLPAASPRGGTVISNGYDWSLTTNDSGTVPGLALPVFSTTTLSSLISDTTGQVVFCSNCTANGGQGTICVSTGTTAAYQFVLSTGTKCR